MAKIPDIKFPSWKGAWPEVVFFSFYKLTGEDSITTVESARSLGELAFPGPGQIGDTTRDKRIAEFLSQVRAHDGYRRLMRLGGFNDVMAERQRLAVDNGLFGEPFGEVRLLHIIGLLVGSFDPTFKPKRATLAIQRKVHRATRVLHSLLMPGAQPADIFEMSELRNLLKRLDAHLAASIEAAETTGTRPHRADSDAAQRYWLVELCAILLRTFGEAPPAIVKEVAAMIGYTPDDVTIARYIARAQANRMPTLIAEELLVGTAANR